MAKRCTYSIAFKRQVVQEYLAGKTLHGPARRYELSRNPIRIWVDKYEARAFDEDAEAANSILVAASAWRRALPKRLADRFGRPPFKHIGDTGPEAGPISPYWRFL